MNQAPFDEKFTRQSKDILSALTEKHIAFYDPSALSGPALYFHIKALEASKLKNFEPFVEYAYAMLVAWGMDRKGRQGYQMQDFPRFRESLLNAWKIAQPLRERTPANLTEQDWGIVKKVFLALDCLKGKTHLVAHSKVMAHLLPNLIAPVDREYVLRFLFGNTSIQCGGEREWKKFHQVLTGFFHPLVQSPKFLMQAEKWRAASDHFPWDTSLLKIADNLIIGASRLSAGNNKE